MNKDASEFMLDEYDRISNAYFGLRDQVNEWFKAYITLVALPVTVLAAVLKLDKDGPTVSLAALPDTVSGLLLLVAVLGFFVVLSILAMRMEMIMYARTINGVRRYFGVLDQARCNSAQDGAQPQIPELTEYLILPTTDTLPPYFESWRAMFWQVIFIGLVDGAILSIAIHSLLGLSWLWSILDGVLYGFLHLGTYALMAGRRSSLWNVRFPANLQPSEW